jgi:chromosome segregation ATPase
MYRSDLAKSFDMALGTFDLVTQVRATAADVEQATVRYRPIHKGVRRLQQEMRDIDAEIAELTNDIRRLKRSEATIPSDISDIENRIEALMADKVAVEGEIPESWEAEQKQFVSLLNAEKKARRDYRRNVDRAYEPVQKTLAVALSGGDLATISADIEALTAIAENGSVEEVKAALKAARKALSGAAPDISSISSVLTKADRALKKDGRGRDKTVEFVAEAIDLYKNEVTWRERAATDLFAGLNSYDDAIKNSIGLRLQDRLPTSIARSVAACRSKHTDISLNF